MSRMIFNTIQNLSKIGPGLTTILVDVMVWRSSTSITYRILRLELNFLADGKMESADQVPKTSEKKLSSGLMDLDSY